MSPQKDTDISDTIVAQSTPVGEGAIGIVRLSGPKSRDILQKIFRGSAQVDQFESHKLYFGKIVSNRFSLPPVVPLTKGDKTEEVLDQVMAVWMKSPHSFTGEEMVEIQGHGGILLLQNILKLLVELGARLAEPGEFSKRSFLNGKIDLTQAEAIADLIHAKSDWEAKNALSQLGGALSVTITNIREKLITFLARVEVGFDFSEEDIKPSNPNQSITFLKEICGEVEILVDSFQTGQLYKDGLRVALIGRPNVGKSSLLNTLLNEDRAIVHHEPGTTRDVVAGEKKLSGIITTFFDTAGIRKTSQSVEVAGIERSRLVLEKSDLVLLLLDSSQPLTDEDQTLLKEIHSKPSIIIYSKCDLPPAWKPDSKIVASFRLVKVSSRERIGIKELENEIYELLIKEKLPNSHNYVLNNVRYYKVLQEIHHKLKEVIELIGKKELGDDCLAEELRIMSNQLGGITGKITNEMVLDEIFQKFCIGK